MGESGWTVRAFECGDCHRHFFATDVNETEFCPYCGSDDYWTHSEEFHVGGDA
jgi:rRNA maturation endonuclease Nob1